MNRPTYIYIAPVKQKSSEALWTAYRNSPTLFQTVPSPTPTASPTPRFGLATSTKNFMEISGKRVVIEKWLIVLVGVAYVFPLRSIVFTSLLVMFNIRENFRKYPPNTKFPENLQP